MLKDIDLHIEAILFTAQQAVNIGEIQKALEKLNNVLMPLNDISMCIETLIEKYERDTFAFALVPISDGYQFLTKTEYHKTISCFLQLKSQKKLSKAAMETLAIIAYKQPITKAEIEQIRGVNCDYSVQKLLEKDLIAIKGRSEAAGRPLLYSTSSFFMNYFGLSSIKDLPALKDIKPQENAIGLAEA